MWLTKAQSNVALISGLKAEKVVTNPFVETAMLAVDRGAFSRQPRVAYFDEPHSIGYGQTISAPHMHAYCLEQLVDHIVPGARVLDVGSGSGYLTACMAYMVGPTGFVDGIDIVPELVEESKQNIQKGCPQVAEWGNYNVQTASGWTDLGEEVYDAVHVGAAAASIPEPLVRAMKPGARMLIPVGPNGGSQTMYLIDKLPDGTMRKRASLGVRYVPLIDVRTPPKGTKVKAKGKAAEAPDDTCGEG